MNLTARILIGMAVGLLLGVGIQQLGLAPEHWLRQTLVGDFLDAGGKIFINSLKLMVVPLVFVSLVCGAASLGRTGRMGALGGKTLALYLTTTAIAISIALCLALIVNPGISASDDPSLQLTEADKFEPKAAPSTKDTIVNIVPTNPVLAMAEGKMLQVIFFALLFGIALSRSGERGTRINQFFEDVNEILMNLITLLITFAPIGVFCLMATLFATIGWEQVGKLIAYFLTVAGALLIHATVVFPILLLVFARVSPIRFLKKMREPMLVAFSTSSSGATLPVTLRTVEERIGVNNQVASFAVPLGATINMDGTAIMQGVATVFISQFYGIGLDFGDYLTVIGTATLASIGTAAVPGVGLVMLSLVLSQVGLPVEGIALIIGVDRLLDMMRTAVNVTGDATVATIVARTEGQLDMAVFQDPDAGRVIPKSA